jgi:hypothetical protein
MLHTTQKLQCSLTGRLKKEVKLNHAQHGKQKGKQKLVQQK